VAMSGHCRSRSRGSRAALVVCVLVCAALLSVPLAGCGIGVKEAPQAPDVSGLSITVWDAAQPRVEGVADYRQAATRVAAEFAGRCGLNVDLRFVARQQIADLLLGKTAGERPHLVFTTEWPFAPLDLPGVPELVDEASYLDAAASYWKRDGRILAIPSYIHWIGLVSRGDAPVGTEALRQETAYFADSPAFLRLALDSPGAGWDAEKVASYLAWVKETYGPPPVDPLAAWDEETVQAIFPVTAYLLRWLRERRGELLRLLPLAGPFGEPGFYYTVPGYVVLAAEEPYRSCAADLGRELAANLGRWAARAVGAIPAAVSDLAVFNVESGLSFEERSALIRSVSTCRSRVPATDDYLYRESVVSAVRQDAWDFLSGKTTEAEARRSIREALERYTRP